MSRIADLHLEIVAAMPRSRAELYALCTRNTLSSQWVEIKPRMFGGYCQGVTVAICSFNRAGRTVRKQVTPKGECYAVFAMSGEGLPKHETRTTIVRKISFPV